MSQYAGDLGSQLMFARSQYEQNAKRKNVVIPKGTTFKNVKIRSNYDFKNGTYYLSTLGIKDEKRGDYDEGQRAFKESDFKVTNLLKEGNNFFNVKNFLVVKNNGFDISENAIVDIELNKDITVSIFDEPFVDPILSNTGIKLNQPVVNQVKTIAPTQATTSDLQYYTSANFLKRASVVIVPVGLIGAYCYHKKFSLLKSALLVSIPIVAITGLQYIGMGGGKNKYWGIFVPPSIQAKSIKKIQLQP